ncbi:hypothetical protein I7I48_00383 [Histoplasma ohiense]|nr:hypothetical protein I7I48_00383 [Histoplasma ohiense (nom. inval.)]
MTIGNWCSGAYNSYKSGKLNMYLSRRSGRTCDKSRSQNALFLLQRLGRDGFMDGDRALATRFDQSPSFVCLCQVSSQRTGLGRHTLCRCGSCPPYAKPTRTFDTS